MPPGRTGLAGAAMSFIQRPTLLTKVPSPTKRFTRAPSAPKAAASASRAPASIVSTSRVRCSARLAWFSSVSPSESVFASRSRVRVSSKSRAFSSASAAWSARVETSWISGVVKSCGSKKDTSSTPYTSSGPMMGTPR